MTKEELLNKKGRSLRMKDLREFVENNKDVDDNSPVVVERVEDFYFTENMWDVLKVEGYHYHSALEWNIKMKDEIRRRKKGEEPEYDIENPKERLFSKEQLEGFKEQFYRPHCITTDKEIVYIYSHY